MLYLLNGTIVEPAAEAAVNSPRIGWPHKKVVSGPNFHLFCILGQVQGGSIL